MPTNTFIQPMHVFVGIEKCACSTIMSTFTADNRARQSATYEARRTLHAMLPPVAVNHQLGTLLACQPSPYAIWSSAWWVFIMACWEWGRCNMSGFPRRVNLGSRAWYIAYLGMQESPGHIWAL